MGDRVKYAGKALAFAAIYFIAYRFAWGYSADQFFLPAGVRIAALLFAPYRLWPSIFLGDAAALISIRLPIADHEGIGYEWVYGSSLLLCPLVSAAPLLARRLYPTITLQDRLLSAVLLPTALWAVCCSTALNSVFGYPMKGDVLSYLYRFGVGQYLAMLIVVLPTLLWLRRNERHHSRAALIRHGAVAVVVLLCAYAGAGVATEAWQRLALLGCMIVPVLALTARHGWRGAAIGIAAANLAMGLSMPTTGLLGNQDNGVFVAQQTLAVISTFMLIVGSMMSRASEKAHRMVAVAIESRAMARAQELRTEEALRDRAEALAVVQMQANEAWRETVQQLKAEGHYQLAMQVNSQSLANTKMLYEQAAALYPFRIETVGLYAALNEASFARVLGGSTASLFLCGDLSKHSITLQVAAYRAICLAIDILPADQYTIHARTWSLRGERGISVRILAPAGVKSVGSMKSRTAEMQLGAKMHAYGGSSKRRRRSVIFMLGDGGHFLARGTTIQDAPLSPLSTLTVKSSEL
ncbi:hypothetical protein GGR77_001544 [Xanthomonas translucens]